MSAEKSGSKRIYEEYSQPKWFDREPAPGKARIMYESTPGVDPVVVVDVSIDTLKTSIAPKIEKDRKMVIVESNSDPDDPYDELSHMLGQLIDHRHRRVGIVVPDDSPIRSLPNIKYELPPGADAVRVEILLTDEEKERAKAHKVHSHVIGEMPVTQLPKVKKYLEDTLQKSDQGDNKIDKQDDSRFRMAEKDLFNLNSSYAPSAISLESAELDRFHVRIDPEAPGYNFFIASQKQKSRNY